MDTFSRGRALVAVHATSMSWRDYLLVCALMNLPVPGRNATKRSLEKLVSCTSQVAQESMTRPEAPKGTAKEIKCLPKITT